VATVNESYESVSLGDLRPHPRNPRHGSVEAIRQSIGHNGFYGAVVAQKSTGYILAGNHRWMAARESGMAEVPVIWVDVDDERALKILLADNRTNDLATYDESQLADILAGLANTSDLLGTGYDGDDLDELIGDIERVALGNQESLIPATLVLRPTWNTKRTINFLSVRKWLSGAKHAQSQELRQRKDAGDRELAHYVGVECAEVLAKAFGALDGFVVVSAPRGRSGGTHFASEAAKVVAASLGVAYEEVFTPSEKRTRGVVGEVDTKSKPVRNGTPASAHVILFDDVATTGTTLEACRKALMPGFVIPLAWIYEEAAAQPEDPVCGPF
jgi:hypothetical protein